MAVKIHVGADEKQKINKLVALDCIFLDKTF